MPECVAAKCLGERGVLFEGSSKKHQERSLKNLIDRCLAHGMTDVATTLSFALGYTLVDEAALLAVE